MREIIAKLLIALILHTGALYPMTGIVVEVNYDEDIVAVEDFNGNIWEFYGCEDWAEGDIASMLMYDNGTEIIYDDEIVSVRYCGYAR